MKANKKKKRIQGIRGWVYAITCETWPDLIKVGYSLKDPNIRAKVFSNSAGAPDPHIVQYDVLLFEPYKIEQQVHSALKDFRHKKEWYKCSLTQVVETIRKIIGDGAIKENVIGKIEAPKAQKIKEENLQPDKMDQINSTTLRTRGMKIRATYKGACPNCKNSFTVTVLRNEKITICPECGSSIDLSVFYVQEFNEKII